MTTECGVGAGSSPKEKGHRQGWLFKVRFRMISRRKRMVAASLDELEDEE
jgi:hypothetical protein